MILKIYIFLNFLLFFSFSVQADSFQEHLIKFLKEKQTFYSNNMSIFLYNKIPYKTQMNCFSPTFILLDVFKSSELMNIKVICGHIHQFIQVKVEIKGEYIVASRNIKKGQKLIDSDIFVKYGVLQKKFFKLYLNKKQALNLISFKKINKNELITKNLLHPVWLIKINQKVLVMIKNEGFTIISKGRAINNAYKNQIVRVKLKNGKIILGLVDNDGNVIVT
ncbi:MAG: flagellar basal body P-ring formation chaperone FlgA [Buchnera aphidicola (Nurudea yanoniella)]